MHKIGPGRCDDGQIARARGTLPVKIAAYSSGSNGDAHEADAACARLHHNTLRIEHFQNRRGAAFIELQC
jgi:hypothetical protein